jgi:hypothetical protein
MKVTVLLKNDHEMLKSLFARYKKSSGGRAPDGKKELFNEIQREISIHSQMELEIFYPALAGTSSARSGELTEAAEHDHRGFLKLVQELDGMNASDKDFEPKLNQLIEQVERHIEFEEDEVFDEARKALPEFRLEELGLEMAERRKILNTLAA